jgi:hypothetical protein
MSQALVIAYGIGALVILAVAFGLVPLWLAVGIVIAATLGAVTQSQRR